MTRSGWTQSRRATSDLIEIRNYTVATWGKEQARLYLVGIKSAIERAASADPSHRKSCGDELPGYFRIVVGSHVVFYRAIEDSIRVERILHQRMDFESHL